MIFQQHGVSTHSSKSQSFLKALKTGKFPKEELKKFANGESSLVDDFIDTSNKTLEEQSDILEKNQALSESEIDISSNQLPIIETKDVLELLDCKLTANIDGEAVEFFVHSAISKIWKHAFVDEKEALRQLNAYLETGIYATEVKKGFLEQYQGAIDLPIPPDYNFRIDNQIVLPNLMQRFTAYMIKKNKRFGNWSGTGAGKTLSAILSSRVIDAKLSIICCPNSVVEGWKNNIEAIYPQSIVWTKQLPVISIDDRRHYIILNYEFFQQSSVEMELKKFISNSRIDLVIIDEIHYSKQRVLKEMSKRRKVISTILSEAIKQNSNLHVLGMSATPVINNLFEGKALIELITGLHYDELDTTASVSNCIALYQKFVSYGLRWQPQYSQNLNLDILEIDCSSLIDEIKDVSANGSMVDLESVLTKAKIPEILKHLKPKTIVYTYYLKNILKQLVEAIEEVGWKVAVFTGEDKSGFEEFLTGDAEVLIASSCIGTGVDGLQAVCNRIIVNTLPWTNAEFEQLKGRVYRQGQKNQTVYIIVPLTYAMVNNEKWSWCESRWKRIQFKKSIADAAVDGIIPEGHLRTASQAYQDVMKWLDRLENGGTTQIERRKIDMQFSGIDQEA